MVYSKQVFCADIDIFGNLKSPSCGRAERWGFNLSESILTHVVDEDKYSFLYEMEMTVSEWLELTTQEQVEVISYYADKWCMTYAEEVSFRRLVEREYQELLIELSVLQTENEKIFFRRLSRKELFFGTGGIRRMSSLFRSPIGISRIATHRQTHARSYHSPSRSMAASHDDGGGGDSDDGREEPPAPRRHPQFVTPFHTSSKRAFILPFLSRMGGEMA